MTILSDYTVIEGTSIKIGDGSNENGFTETFNTSGRRSSGKTFISFMVKGMTITTDNADVYVNDVRVGALDNNNGGRTNEWQTQTIVFNGSILIDGDNTLRVSSVPNPISETDHHDDFWVRSIICHFHQSD